MFRNPLTLTSSAADPQMIDTATDTVQGVVGATDTVQHSATETVRDVDCATDTVRHSATDTVRCSATAGNKQTELPAKKLTSRLRSKLASTRTDEATDETVDFVTGDIRLIVRLKRSPKRLIVKPRKKRASKVSQKSAADTDIAANFKEISTKKPRLSKRKLSRKPQKEENSTVAVNDDCGVNIGSLSRRPHKKNSTVAGNDDCGVNIGSLSCKPHKKNSRVAVHYESGVNIGSWVPSKILMIAPPEPSAVVKTTVENSTASCLSRRNKPTMKTLSLQAMRKQRIRTSDSQLTAEPQVIVADIKREPDCDCADVAVKRRRVRSASDYDSDGETYIRETIVLASDEPQTMTAMTSGYGLNSSVRKLKDYDGSARRLLKEYDGTQSVDVEELFDRTNMSEVIDIIEISDDDEWTNIPAEIAGIRYSLIIHI